MRSVLAWPAVSLALAVAPPLGSAGCDETAVVVVVASDRQVPSQIDAFCLEVDAGGRARFHRRVAATTFPQTLTVLPGADDVFEAAATVLLHEQPLDDLRVRVPFRNHEVDKVTLPINRCPSPTSGSFAEVAAPGLAGSAAVALDTPSGPRVLAIGAGGVAMLAVTGAGIVPADPRPVPAAPGPVLAVLSADLDRDCATDLVLLGSGPPHVWRQDGGGGLVELAAALPDDLAGTALAAADFDGDGTLDLAVATPMGTVRLLRGDGTGHFAEVMGGFDQAPSDVTSLGAGDLDGDGAADLLVGRGSAAAAVSRVYINAGGTLRVSPGALPAVQLQVRGVAVADLDGDGTNDVVLVGAGMPVKLYLNRGNGLLEDGSFGRVPAPGPLDAVAVLARDVDRDCRTDLVIALAQGPPLFWAGQGGGVLAAVTVQGASAGASWLSAGDVDGNGARDLVLGGGSGAVWIQQ